MAKSSWCSNVLDVRVTNCCSKALQMKNEKELCTIPSLINSRSGLQAAGLMVSKGKNTHIDFFFVFLAF